MSVVRFFTVSGHLEALSYLLLLGVAMPLKYGMNMPIFVRITGSFHGLFFCMFCLGIVLMARQQKWSLKTAALAFLSAFFPFGPYVFERRFMPPVRTLE